MLTFILKMRLGLKKSVWNQIPALMKLSHALESHAFPTNSNRTVKLLLRENLIKGLRILADKTRQVIHQMLGSTILRFNKQLKRQRHLNSNKVSTFEEQEVNNDCHICKQTSFPYFSPSGWCKSCWGDWSCCERLVDTNPAATTTEVSTCLIKCTQFIK
jgi:hypothetical protein